VAVRQWVPLGHEPTELDEATPAARRSLPREDPAGPAVCALEHDAGTGLHDSDDTGEDRHPSLGRRSSSSRRRRGIAASCVAGRRPTGGPWWIGGCRPRGPGCCGSPWGCAAVSLVRARIFGSLRVNRSPDPSRGRPRWQWDERDARRTSPGQNERRRTRRSAAPFA
jgi:hypothetical protein